MLNRIKIAIIEDDVPIRQLYELKLSKEGYSVETATNGHDGLVLLEAFRPEVTLLDIRMPVMNGDEMLAKLRVNPWAAEMKIIILTNLSKDEAPLSLRFLGVDRYVVKAHHTPSQIADIVKDVLDV